MRLPLRSLLSATCSLLICGAAAAEPQPTMPQPSTPPELVKAPVDKIFAPQGFDDNDEVQVVLHGQFLNACYRTGPAIPSVDVATKTITIDAKSYKVQGLVCAEILIKFVEPVKLGVLPKGAYHIVMKDNTAAAPVDLEVAEAKTDARDNTLYAPVQLASVDTNDEGHDILRLEGDYPYMLVGCMVTSTVTTKFNGGVLVVKPMSRIVEGEACASQHKSNRFKLVKDLGMHRAGDDYLIHVRTLNGNAVNRLVDNTPTFD